ncbi:cation:proton antiporter [Gryllotalpicola protaetiae]|uniref:Cation:proton antiporter n=1 Tax=Gryllotalpicola protaetiae TaxID=2419771 RepID=A0A387C3X0_9MICO|nr:cation:proton antiporter [Gryllotalpicola protaetiae]
MLAAQASDHGDLAENLIVLGILFIIAYVLGRLARRIGLPAIPVYMVVGLLASPHTQIFPLDFEAANIQLIAVFGLLLLLFSLGVEFDQEDFFGNFHRLLISGGSYVAINLGAGIAFGFWVGWGTREALIIAGMTATSSSAIVTKLLIELRRLTNDETPMILGVTVIEDIFIAIYLAIISAALSHATGFWPITLRLVLDFVFIVLMFAIARWGGRFVSRLLQTKDDELFTVLFFGLAIVFGGIGEYIGVTDAIGAFLIGVVLGATRYHGRIERVTVPLRDIFAAFFFLNFGLDLDVAKFPEVTGVVIVAVVMTLLLNFGASQLIARLNRFGFTAGVNTFVILQNRGEFVLILATLAVGAGLDSRLTPFAGMYVLIMAVIGPLMAANSDRFNAWLRRRQLKRALKKSQPASSQVTGEITEVGKPHLDPAIDAAMDSDPRKQPEDL